MKTSHGQTFIEYALLLSVVVALGIAMMPMLSRAVQGVVKITADQVGVQNEADQTFGYYDDGRWVPSKDGFLVNVSMKTQAKKITSKEDRAGAFAYIYPGDSTSTGTEQLYNLGYTSSQ